MSIYMAQPSTSKTEPDTEPETETRIAGMPVSRDPADYSPCRHMMVRWHRQCGPARETRTAPPITGDVVRQCITSGDISQDPSGPDRARFTCEVDGHTWRLVARLTCRGTNEVLTAFSPGHHQPTEFDLSGGRR